MKPSFQSVLLWSYRSARSPSPVFQPISTIRRRSPSPVKTGAVNRARNRFETSSKPNHHPDYTGEASSQQHMTNGHQTLPKTFKLGAASRVQMPGSSVGVGSTGTTTHGGSTRNSQPWGSSSSASNTGGGLSRHSSFTAGSRNSNNGIGNSNKFTQMQSHHKTTPGVDNSRLMRQESLPAPPIRNGGAGVQINRQVSYPKPSEKKTAAVPSAAAPPPSAASYAKSNGIGGAKIGNGPSAGFSASMKSIPNRFLMQDAANYLSQKLPSLSSSQSSLHQLKSAAPSLVNAYVKTPFGYS